MLAAGAQDLGPTCSLQETTCCTLPHPGACIPLCFWALELPKLGSVTWK